MPWTALDQSLGRYRNGGDERTPRVSHPRPQGPRRRLARSTGACRTLPRRCRSAMQGRFLEPAFVVRIIAAHLRIGERAEAARWLITLRRNLIAANADSVALLLAESQIAAAAGRWRSAVDLLAGDPLPIRRSLRSTGRRRVRRTRGLGGPTRRWPRGARRGRIGVGGQKHRTCGIACRSRWQKARFSSAIRPTPPRCSRRSLRNGTRLTVLPWMRRGRGGCWSGCGR